MLEPNWYSILFSFVTDLLLPPLVVLILIKEGIVVFAERENGNDPDQMRQHFNSPFRYILRSITLVGELIENKAELTALLSGRDSVQADVEVSAVVGISVLGVGVELAELISWGTGGALEAIGGLKS